MTFKKYEPKPLFLERMQQLLPDKKDFQNYLEAIKKESQNSIRCNTIKIQPEELKKRLEDKGWKIKQPFKEYPEIFIIEGKFAENKFSDINDEKLVNENKCKNLVNQDNKICSTNYDNKSSAKSRDEVRLGATSISKPQRGERSLQHLAPGELGRSLEHLLGYYYVQDISSMLSILALNPKPHEKFLDLCSAPGSKTTQAAAKMENTGLIIANEVKFDRISILASNIERCGVSNCVITKKDGINLCEFFRRNNIFFDKILVDAPCSGEGTIISNPKTLQIWNFNMIKQLSRLQKSLLLSALSILKPNGELIYSTCTHAPEENEEVVDFALQKYPNLKIEKINLPIKCRQGITKWDDKQYSQEVKKCARIYPQDNLTEGFFVVKIRKIK